MFEMKRNTLEMMIHRLFKKYRLERIPLKLHSKNYPVLGMNKVTQGKSVIQLFLKISLCITISMESSRRDLFIDMVVDRFIYKITINYALSASPSHPKQV